MSRTDLDRIRKLAVAASQLTQAISLPAESLHPFERRGISGVFPSKVQSLFDDGHFAEAAFTAAKYFDRLVQRAARSHATGKDLMMQAFREAGPLIQISDTTTETGRSQQEGMKFLAAGSILFVRNPRGHEVEIPDSAEDCLDYLGIFATLVRVLARAGFQ